MGDSIIEYQKKLETIIYVQQQYIMQLEGRIHNRRIWDVIYGPSKLSVSATNYREACLKTFWWFIEQFKKNYKPFWFQIIYNLLSHKGYVPINTEYTLGYQSNINLQRKYSANELAKILETLLKTHITSDEDIIGIIDNNYTSGRTDMRYKIIITERMCSYNICKVKEVNIGLIDNLKI
jgi:hypothetical protein